MANPETLFVYSGTRRLLVIILAIFLSLFLILVLIAIYVEPLNQFAADSLPVVGVLVLSDFIFLLFARDFEFYDEFLKIIDFNQTRIVPYWEIEHIIISSNETETFRSNNSIELKLRNSMEILRIKGNPVNHEIGITLYDFLRKKTAPRIVFHYKL